MEALGFRVAAPKTMQGAPLEKVRDRLWSTYAEYCIPCLIPCPFPHYLCVAKQPFHMPNDIQGRIPPLCIKNANIILQNLPPFMWYPLGDAFQALLCTPPQPIR